MKHPFPRWICLLWTALLPLFLGAQGHESRLAAINVLHYKFSLVLSDSTDEIQGEAEIRLRLAHPVQEVVFDLVGRGASGKGMVVKEVIENGSGRQFRQEGEQLIVSVSFRDALERTYRIKYRGIPADGLIISKNAHGDRTFFGDNWPNRAHHYLPCIDHPSDKATVEFIVTAPVHYQVVSNGIQIEETNLAGGMKLTHFRSEEVLPTKVMVIGAAEFAVQLAGQVGAVPVTSWIFMEEREAGFKEYGRAVEVLRFFVDQMGPYPYQKLANVQSRTRYGGMENAGCIFYSEESAKGDGQSEALIAHEIAHQWFGNSASEANWHHVWLSEGFATYWANLYFEMMRGKDVFLKRMKAERATVADFGPTWKMPVVDTTVTDYNMLLNPNSYEKGSWVLHMLRRRVTDSVFMEIMRVYYKRYQYANALTGDFRKVAEEVSGQDLRAFFQQWLYTPGHPKLDITWSYNKGKQVMTLNVAQTQPGAAFVFPLEVAVVTESGQTVNKTFDVTQRAGVFTLALAVAPAQVVVDPNVWLLYEGKVAQK